MIWELQIEIQTCAQELTLLFIFKFKIKSVFIKFFKFDRISKLK